jgi:hypothetical protein
MPANDHFGVGQLRSQSLNQAKAPIGCLKTKRGQPEKRARHRGSPSLASHISLFSQRPQDAKRADGPREHRHNDKGHGSITDDRYTHLLPGEIEAAGEQFATYLAASQRNNRPHRQRNALPTVASARNLNCYAL